MDEKKQKGTSSSFPAELSGSKEPHPSSSSSGIFEAIFSPPLPKVLGRESLRAELSKKTANETWISKINTQDDSSKGNGGEAQNTKNKDMSSFYQEQKLPPTPLCSSIYYGGQDTYYHPQSTQNAGLNSLNKNDVGDDDSGMATRGNWWQGSLYY